MLQTLDVASSFNSTTYRWVTRLHLARLWNHCINKNLPADKQKNTWQSAEHRATDVGQGVKWEGGQPKLIPPHCSDHTRLWN